MSFIKNTLQRVSRRLGAVDPQAFAQPQPPRAGSDLKGPYVSHVQGLQKRLSRDEAMEEAVGGGDFTAIGEIMSGLVRHYGLPADGYLVDVGCGSGRLARPISPYLKGRYLGFDLVPELIAHAKRITGRPDWRFEVIDHISIPEADGEA